MGLLQRRSGVWRGRSRYWALGLCLALHGTRPSKAFAGAFLRPASLQSGHAARHAGDPWQAALAARRAFEAAASQERTRAAFTQVMDDFRAIYHGDPAAIHAPGAVEQVAELLAEQGRELHDSKSRRAAAGQYEFLAKAYPQSSLAPPALGQALQLLNEGGPEDAGEAARVRLELKQHYPHAAATLEAQDRAPSPLPDVKQAVAPSSSHRIPGLPETRAQAPDTAPSAALNTNTNAAQDVPQSTPLDGRPLPEGAAPAVVTGIRHWSTASYTRVAIDLGGEVQFRAARTEHPDRLFFDLHGAKLAPGLVGKTFAVTDDGFLSTIRAAQAGADVTRVVLDVQPVAEYSAFLLPNPYRLIIDIHGKQPGAPAGTIPAGQGPIPASERVAAVSQTGSGAVAAQTSRRMNEVLSSREAPEPSAPPNPVSEQAAAPITRSSAARSTGAISTLPPMPVTDGSAGFGLPPKRNGSVTAASETAVARPRVVVTAKPTTARPVPNTVSSATPDSSREVAALSETPGVMSATAKPTSRPVVDRGTVVTSRIKKSPAADGTGTGTAVAGETGSARVGLSAAPVAPPPPTADGQSTLMRALGLKIGRIVIDAGHGGHDSGTLGPDGIEEKDVVLDVALRLGKLLHDRLGAEVVYTRADDTFVPLETRTAIANKAQADLFISVHANSSGDPDVRGVEVYYLNFTSDPEAMEVASRENAVSSQRVNQLSDLVKKIALKDKIDESRELAADVDQSLYSGLRKGNGGLKDRGVKKAPFVVLIGANMPSILAEISFVTNPDDAEQLQTPEYRERVAESLYNGIARYASAINTGKPRTKVMERAQR